MSTLAKRSDLSDYDEVQLCMPDIHTVPRGKVVTGKYKDSLLKEELDIWKGKRERERECLCVCLCECVSARVCVLARVCACV